MGFRIGLEATFSQAKKLYEGSRLLSLYLSSLLLAETTATRELSQLKDTGGIPGALAQKPARNVSTHVKVSLKSKF